MSARATITGAALALGLATSACGERPVLITEDRDTLTGDETSAADTTSTTSATDTTSSTSTTDVTDITDTTGTEASDTVALDALDAAGDALEIVEPTGDAVIGGLVIGLPAASSSRVRVRLDWWASPSTRLRWRAE